MAIFGARTRAGRLIPAVSTGEAPSSALPPGETHVTPQLNYDLSTLQPLPPYDIPSLHSPIWGAQPTLPRRTRTPVLAPPQPEPPSSSCTLVTPTGNYHAPHAIALFQPQMARALSSAIGVLNRQGIIPTMTDGYRTEAMQQARRRHSNGARAASRISGHQVGLSADWGPASNNPNFDAVSQAMTTAGLANGAHFRDNPDAFHFMLPGTIRNQTVAQASACAAAYRRRQR